MSIRTFVSEWPVAYLGSGGLLILMLLVIYDVLLFSWCYPVSIVLFHPSPLDVVFIRVNPIGVFGRLVDMPINPYDLVLFVLLTIQYTFFQLGFLTEYVGVACNLILNLISLYFG